MIEQTFKPHEMRVVEEENELKIKIDKLSEFITTKIFQNLDNKDKDLLVIQRLYMSKYRDVLVERIKRFAKTI